MADRSNQQGQKQSEIDAFLLEYHRLSLFNDEVMERYLEGITKTYCVVAPSTNTSVSKNSWRTMKYPVEDATAAPYKAD